MSESTRQLILSGALPVALNVVVMGSHPPFFARRKSFRAVTCFTEGA